MSSPYFHACKRLLRSQHSKVLILQIIHLSLPPIANLYSDLESCYTLKSLKKPSPTSSTYKQLCLPALLLPAIVTARPQYMLPGDTACGDEGSQYTTTTTTTADVTTAFGDQGWINYDGNVCEAGTARESPTSFLSSSCP